MFVALLLPLAILLEVGVGFVGGFVTALLYFLYLGQILREEVIGFVVVGQFTNFTLLL